MALPDPSAMEIPAETVALARAACPKGTVPMQIRDALGPIYTDAQFADVFAWQGRPAESPARLTLVSMFQFLEDLSDQQAADAVRTRMDWKYALGLPLADPGFSATVLSDFRARLVTHDHVLQLLTTMLEVWAAHGLLHHQRQRTDSTGVLAAITSLRRLELVGETLRAALNALAQAAPDWVRATVPADWYDRYATRFAAARLPARPDARTDRKQTIGIDGAVLLVSKPTYNWLLANFGEMTRQRYTGLHRTHLPGGQRWSCWPRFCRKTRTCRRRMSSSMPKPQRSRLN